MMEFINRKFIRLTYIIFREVKTNTRYKNHTGRQYIGKITHSNASYYWGSDVDYTILTHDGENIILNEYWLEPCGSIGKLLYKWFDNSAEIIPRRVRMIGREMDL